MSTVQPDVEARPAAQATAARSAEDPSDEPPALVAAYSQFIYRRPLPVMCVMLSVCLLLTAIGMPMLDIITDPPQGRAAYAVESDARTLRLDSYIKARDSSAGVEGASQDELSAFSFDDQMLLLFESRDGGTVFQESRLAAIKGVQDGIMAMADYESFCWRCPVNETAKAGVVGCEHLVDGEFPLCRPPLSPINYFYPSVVDGEPVYDGRGEALADLDATVAMLAAYSDPYLANSTSFSLAREFSADNLVSSWTRVIFSFGLPRPGYTTQHDRPLDQSDEIAEFHVDVEKAVLRDNREEDVGSGLWLGYFSTTGLFALEVENTLANDQSLSMLSIVFVLFYIAYHTQSMFLACFGMTHIILSFPVAVFFSRVMCGIRYFDLMNFLLLYVIIGIGADDIFVLFDQWTHEQQRSEPSAAQLGRVIWKAGNAMFVTSCTTAVAFVATAFSPLMPSSAFGIFASFMIVSNYLLVMTWFPAVLIFWNRHVRPRKICWRRFCDRRPAVQPETGERRERAVVRFYKNKYGPFLRKFHVPVLVALLVVVGVFISLAAQIEDATRAPDFFPDDHMVTRIQHALQDAFKASAEDPAVRAVVLWGLKPYVDRSGFSKFDFGSEECDGGPCGRVQWDTAFDPSSETAQQHMLDMCSDAVADVSCVRSSQSTARCFMQSFKDFREARGEDFPAPQGDWAAALETFFDDETNQRVWLSSKYARYDGGRLHYVSNAHYLTYDPSKFYTGSEIESCYRSWMDFQGNANAVAPEGVDALFVTSNPNDALFTRGKMVEAFAESAVRGVQVAILLAFVVVSASVGTLYMALLVIFCVLCVVVTSLGMFTLLGWELGVVEAICATIVCGFSVDFIVHFALSFRDCRHTSRADRIVHALEDMGVSVVGGAITTSGASAILLLCIFQVFSKFGIFLLSTILCSLVYANCLYAPLVMLVGPDRRPDPTGKLTWKQKLVQFGGFPGSRP